LLIFGEGGKLENPEKNPHVMTENKIRNKLGSQITAADIRIEQSLQRRKASALIALPPIYATPNTSLLFYNMKDKIRMIIVWAAVVFKGVFTKGLGRS